MGEQFRFCGLASFSQAARLAYLQFSEPFAEVAMQNGELPIVCAAAPVELDGELLDGDICALAIDMPAIKAVTAIRVVNIFIFISASLERMFDAAERHIRTTGAEQACSRNSRLFGKKFWIEAN